MLIDPLKVLVALSKDKWWFGPELIWNVFLIKSWNFKRKRFHVALPGLETLLFMNRQNMIIFVREKSFLPVKCNNLYFLLLVVFFRVVTIFILLICAPICNTADRHFTSRIYFNFQRAFLSRNLELKSEYSWTIFICFKVSEFKLWL